MERLKGLEVGQLISSPLVFPPSALVSKIVGVLKQTNDYEIFIKDRDKIGMLTLRDILKASNITQVKAETLAIPVPKLTLRTPVHEAARLLMEYRIRALPLVSDGEIVGRVTSISIIDALKDLKLNYRAADIMTSQPIILDADAPASKARQLMVQRQIDHLPILLKRRLQGILTSSHLVFNMFQATETIERSTIFSEEQRKLEIPVKSIMDLHPLTCNPGDGISRILDEMKRLKATYSLVQLWEEVQGIITYRDYMKLVVEQFRASSVPIYIVGLPDDPFEAEMARSKFRRAVEFLKKSLPYIEEAKSTIKTFPTKGKARKRYEVKVSIITPKRIFTYSEIGWELSTIFDDLANKLKKLVQKQRRTRPKSREPRD